MATTSPPPARRFHPEPIESTIKSSRSAQEQSDNPSSSSTSAEGSSSNTNGAMSTPNKKPRRFLPQPVEESSRSSRRKNEEEHVENTKTSVKDPTVLDDTSHPDEGPNTPESQRTPRRFAVQPVESSTRSSRRKFNPEPIETSSRKSKDKDNPPEDEETTPKPRRKFAPEPVETTARSSKDKQAVEETQGPRPRRKFAAEPIEVTSTTNRRRKASLDEISEEPSHIDDSASSSRASSGPRKFSPELLETAKGSYRRYHPRTPDTSVSPAPSRREYSPPPIEEDPTCEEVPDLPEESRFSAAALSRKNSEVVRQHSFAIPDLPIIESSAEDEDSEAPSLTDSSSSLGSTFAKKTPALSSAKDSYTEYVLRMAAETVSERELQDQAMAAYINERPHEPVDHFAIDHDEDEEGPLPSPIFQGEKGADIRTFRRSSAAELQLEMDHMRKHHEQLEAAKRELKADTAGQSRFSAAALATRHAMEAKGFKKTKKARAEDEDSELARMRAAASPPMLGSDIVFPYTISPKMTRCDPDQAPRPRTNDSDDEEDEPTSPELWHSAKKAESNTGEGLWMGVCQAGLWQPQSPRNGLKSGIQTPSPGTPAAEKNNPFESTTPGRGTRTPARRRAPFPAASVMPLTPPRSQDGDDIFTSTIDKKLQLEKQIEEEFPNRVITQVYNYLSLGYPSLAHAFDDELSKIARIPIEELRKDDHHVDAKGYVGAPEGDGWEESEVIGRCKRWEALRVYVKEWARQSPGFSDERRRVALGANEDWGARARRGSWAH